MISMDISSGNKNKHSESQQNLGSGGFFYFKKSMIKPMIGLNCCHYTLKYGIIY